MDANKRLKLIDSEYKILPTCGMCDHADLGPGADFGTCKTQTYQHEKHSDSTRQLSIHRHGSCNRFVPNNSLMWGLGPWKEFVK